MKKWPVGREANYQIKRLFAQAEADEGWLTMERLLRFSRLSSRVGTEIHELDPLGWPMHHRRSALPLALTSEDR